MAALRISEGVTLWHLSPIYLLGPRSAPRRRAWRRPRQRRRQKAVERRLSRRGWDRDHADAEAEKAHRADRYWRRW